MTDEFDEFLKREREQLDAAAAAARARQEGKAVAETEKQLRRQTAVTSWNTHVRPIIDHTILTANTALNGTGVSLTAEVTSATVTITKSEGVGRNANAPIAVILLNADNLVEMKLPDKSSPGQPTKPDDVTPQMVEKVVRRLLETKARQIPR